MLEIRLPKLSSELKDRNAATIYVPQSLNILRQPAEGESRLKFEVPALTGDPDAQGAPRCQVLMLKDPMSKANVSSVTREVYAEKNEICYFK
jgi:hypothetical protein